MSDTPKIEPNDAPAGGWGSVRSLAHQARENGQPLSVVAGLAKQNKADGFACVSCAWAKPAKPHPAEFCENGAKATFWELAAARADADFFAQHTVTELRGWSDYDLENAGRLMQPMRYDAASDHYVPVSWDEAFSAIGRELKAIRAVDPNKVVFYASGRASLETSYMYQLMARVYGTNNLPDSSNMCHESTSVALPESIGIPVGTVRLDDFETAEAFFFFGHNTGSNAPRMLHQLQEAVKRGAEIVTFNPLKERGLERFVNPQSPLQMATNHATEISSQYHQVKAGGDIAAITGICKALLATDDADLASGGNGVLDREFLAEHTHGAGEFIDYVRSQNWDVLVRESGLPIAAMVQAADTYSRAKSVIGIYGMGLTQHKLGVQAVQMLVNLLLLRGNIGRPGAGICPVRGHSNVQGQRTVGISEKTKLVPLDRLKELYHFEPPYEDGLTTVDACQSIIKGDVEGFIGLGGNFLRAVPEREVMEERWPAMRLTVQIATRLNRGQLFNGSVSYLLPCLGRTEIDEQASGPQAVSVEDSTSCIHGSRGFHAPAGPGLYSETKIVAGIAKATLPDNPDIPWDEWVNDYARVRDAIEATYPKIFKDFNKRLFTPGGFEKPLAARERDWQTDTGKANFKVPTALSASFAEDHADIFRLMTLRSNDQFNTTVYGYSDRFRGVEGTRMVIFLNVADMQRLGIAKDDTVSLVTATDDNIVRRLDGLRAVPHSIPEGCCGAYYPECNSLIPLWQHAEKSKVPAAKSVPVYIVKDGSKLAPMPVYSRINASQPVGIET
ncbi:MULTISPECIES: FdhF/YdeP family oxidoreductase [Rhizobium]|uniref:FdhF/YdeP family oxidoreductase n=1 Tax=Rhizobium rhododendri TaxID=2506430 RepID=A0ABY8IEN0_9HYPH|nr:MULTISPECIES: FdhF/YdeP family oxidoreductase [Rhizobium]MBZ5759273.1 FdhF/YdeP family oxidoreductase [Rhizobium sp. VS19-DR96]MBZ5763896.1 FdhF/YdeP family oxidoreductase [Rhizobium sp. VS19-DR129.2]MBZ5771440.1 FdhF/YdeP family oxidoreductase [Rhizobium sp. VS19-DRK62.2]MBZ5783873.1 FdhF/YdeP family oxidoreductase [Rhizobium sp. VS19-DR121]MBZ5801453.1 FdhF/YdeP family oxidoreductase [Rhizobium sp. VS19-DR181]